MWLCILLGSCPYMSVGLWSGERLSFAADSYLDKQRWVDFDSLALKQLCGCCGVEFRNSGLLSVSY